MIATLRAIICLVIWIAFSATAWADAFDDGLAAYQSQDYSGALRHWQEAAGQGNARAMLNLGVMYDRGQGIAENDGEAVKWYQAAAGAGIAEAQYYLGQKYRSGQGVGQNIGEAAQWYRRAADKGHIQAQRMLSLLYLNGSGVDRDYGEALNWARKAADQGDVQSLHNIGYMYQNGLGVAENPAEATNWYRKAAEQGFVRSQYSLGIMYMSGQGVPVDYAQAERWLRMAAEAGNAAAQTGLGALYANGQGVEQDNATAHMWFRMAAEQGYEPAIEYRDMIAKRLDADQLAQAQNQASERLQLQSAIDYTPSGLVTDTESGRTETAGPRKANSATAIFFPLESNKDSGNSSEGTVTWDRLEKDGEPPAIRAFLEFAEPSFTIELTISKNTDEYLPATHLVEITISSATAFSEIPVGRIPALFLKADEKSAGTALAGAGVRVTDTLYWLALSENPETAWRNIALLRSSNWFDLPIELKDKTRSLIAFSKGAAGKRVIESVIAKWGGPASAKAEQEAQ